MPHSMFDVRFCARFSVRLDVRPTAILAIMLAAACGGSSSGGTTTQPITVTLVTITPPAPPVTFGALGRTVQLTVVVMGSNGSPIASPTVAWSSANNAAATVNATTGLVTAVANGTAVITATSGGVVSGGVTITVAQVAMTVAVTSTSATPDTLKTATRTRQFTATARDSTNNAVGGATFMWGTSAPGVATVNAANGLVTSGTTAGAATIAATLGLLNGTRAMVVSLFPATLTLSPKPSTITIAAGTQLFTGVAQDSVGTNIPISWLAANPTVATISPATGTTTTATALTNGVTNIRMSAGASVDSSVLTVSGQGGAAAPLTIAVNTGDNFFRSVRNNTINAAVDTLGVGGTITWTWVGSSFHSVQSTGAPSFTSSTPAKTSGTYALLFNTIGTYTYQCGVHGASMSGTLVVK